MTASIRPLLANATHSLNDAGHTTLSRDASKETTRVTVPRACRCRKQDTWWSALLIPPTDDPRLLFDHLGAELRRHGTAARDLLTITFQPHGGQVSVRTRRQPLSERYPQLSEIFEDIGRTCRDEGIAVEQLRRISFFEDEVNLEADDAHGGSDVFTWPIRPGSLDS